MRRGSPLSRYADGRKVKLGLSVNLAVSESESGNAFSGRGGKSSSYNEAEALSFGGLGGA